MTFFQKSTANISALLLTTVVKPQTPSFTKIWQTMEFVASQPWSARVRRYSRYSGSVRRASGIHFTWTWENNSLHLDAAICDSRKIYGSRVWLCPARSVLCPPIPLSAIYGHFWSLKNTDTSGVSVKMTIFRPLEKCRFSKTQQTSSWA